MNKYNNVVFFFRHLYFPQVPYSHLAVELDICLSSPVLAANNLSYLPVPTTEQHNQITAGRVSYGSSSINHNTIFSMTLQINELLVKFLNSDSYTILPNKSLVHWPSG